LHSCTIAFTGATENAGVESAIRSKMQAWKMQEWKMREQTARVENVGVGKAEPVLYIEDP